MSDISDVANGLAYTIAGLIYPSGMSSASVTGRRTIIRRGWLSQSDYQGACSLAKGVDYVTVQELGPSVREIAADLGAPWRPLSRTTPTVAISASGNMATISIPSGETASGLVGIRVRASSSSALPIGTSAVYAASSADTASSIASGLASQISGASSSGAVVTVNDASILDVVSAGSGTDIRVLARQTQNFTVSIWSNDWQARDALGKAITDGLMSSLWFVAGDGWPVNIPQSPASANIDTLRNQGIWRRDIRIAARYDTTATQAATPMLFGTLAAQTAADSVVLHPEGVAVTGPDGRGRTTFGFVPDAAGDTVGAVQVPYPGLALDAAGNVTQG